MAPATRALDSYPVGLVFLERYYAMLGNNIEVNLNYIFQHK